MLRRNKGLIWLAMVVGAVVLALVIRGVLVQTSSSSDARMPRLGTGQSAKDAYAMIKQWTPAWAPDAAILSCAADYSRKGQASDAWRFQVYSAARGQIVATRIQGTEVIVLHETTALFRQQPMPLDEWTLDSDEAIRIWWDNGGQAAWNRPDSGVLHARLGPNKEHRLVWQMTVTYGVNDALGFWEIAARDGAVLSQNVGGGNE